MKIQDINNVKDSVSKNLQKLTQLEDNIKTQKINEINKMIDYYNDLTNNIEERRNKIYDFTIQLLIICVTGFGVLMTLLLLQNRTYEVKYILISGISILGIQILFCIFITILYLLQSKTNYVFNLPAIREFSNKWKWFYYGNQNVQRINTNPYPFNINKQCDDQYNYLNGLNDFINNYTNENLNAEICDNIQQLFLLQVHNYYKNRFYLTLIKILNISSIISAVLVVASIICGITVIF